MPRSPAPSRPAAGSPGRCGSAAPAPAGGQLLVGVTERFRRGHPDCEVQIREARLTELIPWLRDGTADLALGALPVREPGIVTGPVLVTEARFLAVPAGHPFARRDSLSVEDLAEVTLLRLPDALPASLRADHAPETTPAGRPIRLGRSAATVQELLTLVGANVRRHHARPDVAYVHLRDAPPVRWSLLWNTGNASARVRAFAAADHVAAGR